MLSPVARYAHAHELALARLRIPHAERQIRPIAQMLDVVYDLGPGVAAASLAKLALIAIQLQNLGTHVSAPLGPPVEPGLAALVDQGPELSQPGRRDTVDHGK